MPSKHHKRRNRPKQKDEVPTLDGIPLTAIPDRVDFRDQMFIPTLVEVPAVCPLEKYQESGVEVLNQGQEGACTGFGLAAVANYLLSKRKVYPDTTKVSPRMLYEMAKRHDLIPGTFYAGSTPRGAMKGWHKYGVCSEEKWPYISDKKDKSITLERVEDAVRRPLGAYYRVNHKDLVAMHSALAEVGILYVAGMVHEGWSKIDQNGRIPISEKIRGGHAFAIVGYDEKGFWFQNSWGQYWGKDGFGHLSYEDWLKNGKDVWVARLGAPVSLSSKSSTTKSSSTAVHFNKALSFHDLRPHIISLGNDGELKETGDFGNSKEEVQALIHDTLPKITKNWSRKRILLYAHGGLVSESSITQRISEYKDVLLENEIYPICFVWNSDFWSTLKNIFRDAFSKKTDEGFFDDISDFMWDRIDDSIEPLARVIGKPQWDEMKENAQKASSRNGGALVVAKELEKLFTSNDFEIHLAGHSAGSILIGALADKIASFRKIQTCTLWAPACTVEFFKKYYVPLLSGGQKRSLKELAVYVLSDKAERDDNCVQLYHKSLLYLVSQAFEEESNSFNPTWEGYPIFGMEKFLSSDASLKSLFRKNFVELVISPNSEEDPLRASGSTSHGGFDDDKPTLKGLLARIKNGEAVADMEFSLEPLEGGLSDRKEEMRGYRKN